VWDFGTGNATVRGVGWTFQAGALGCVATARGAGLRAPSSTFVAAYI